MNAISRRHLLSASALSLAALPLALQGCGSATAATIDAQIVADVQGLVPATQAIETAVATYSPTAISASDKTLIAGLEQALLAAATGLSATTPVATGATTLQTVEHDLNTVLSVLGAALPAAGAVIPALAPIVVMYNAAVALVTTVLEPYVNTLIAPVAAAPAPLKLAGAAVHYDAGTARSLLGIPTVRK